MALDGSRMPRELHVGGGVPSKGNYKSSLGEGGCSGSMKRTPTAEEREREAKVSGAPRSRGSFVHWELGAGNQKGLAGCERTHGLKPRREGALSAREPETLGL